MYEKHFVNQTKTPSVSFSPVWIDDFAGHHLCLPNRVHDRLILETQPSNSAGFFIAGGFFAGGQHLH
jgi:hypothetical protein